jgi:lysophospholipase L1-like esterase
MCTLCASAPTGHGNLKHATYWGTSALNNSKEMKPDMVIFMLGTNDADEWLVCAFERVSAPSIYRCGV